MQWEGRTQRIGELGGLGGCALHVQGYMQRIGDLISVASKAKTKNKTEPI